MIEGKVDARKALSDLKTFKSTALPYAVRAALTRSAYLAREEWQKEMRASFTLRNRWTERSLRVERATGTNPGAMRATVGSLAVYMGDQEHGGIVRGKSGLKGIPGPVAAGLAPGSKRTKLVRAANRLGALHVRKPQGRSRQQRNAIAISMAKRRGEKAILLERPRGGKGIFKLMGGRKKATVRLLWDFSKRAVHVPATPTLQRTLKRIQPQVEAIYTQSVVEQLKRHNILGY